MLRIKFLNEERKVGFFFFQKKKKFRDKKNDKNMRLVNLIRDVGMESRLSNALMNDVDA